MFFYSCIDNNKKIENDPSDRFGEPFELIICGKKCDVKYAYCKVYNYTWHTGESEELVCVQLPFVEVLKCTGIDVEKNKDNTYDLSFKNGSKYKLSLSKKELRSNTFTENMILPAPGNTHFCCLIQDDEMYLDSTTLFELIYDMFGIRLKVLVDPDVHSVTIVEY